MGQPFIWNKMLKTKSKNSINLIFVNWGSYFTKPNLGRESTVLSIGAFDVQEKLTTQEKRRKRK